MGGRVIGFSIEEIARITGGTIDQVADPALIVSGPVVVDSRHAAPGALFAALPGERVDGHDFAGQAVAAGARPAERRLAGEWTMCPATVSRISVARAAG